MSQLAVVEDAHYTTPLYRKSEAARIIRVPPSTFRGWVDAAVTSPATPGRPRGRRARAVAVATPADSLVTTAEPTTPRGPSVPFVGLAEAYVLASFRSAGVPMQRIRPAVRRLEEQMGLRQALASERLKTDGAEVLWDYGRVTNDPGERDAVGDLVVVRNGQRVFREVVASYLRKVSYESGWARVINVGRGRVDVTVDPWVNGGQPTLARRGVAVSDVMSRVRAGEPAKAVAADYGLSGAEITALLELAA